MAHVSVPTSESETEQEGQAPGTGTAFSLRGFAWAIFEWARNPYYNVIVIYVFATYFSQVIMGGGAEGQAAVARVIEIAGYIMAVSAPILGIVVDKGGGKKGFAFVALLVLGLCALGLGWVKPGMDNVVLFGMTLMIIGYCSYTVCELLHNAMLPAAGEPKALPMISGLGLFMGNIAGVLMLAGLLLANEFIPMFKDIPGGVGSISGPVVAIWLAVFIAPFFLFLPDHKGTMGSWSKAIVHTFTPPSLRLWGGPSGLNILWSLPLNVVVFIAKKFRESPQVMKYLLARMIYADGIAVLLVFGGVYVAGVLGWSPSEVIVYGITGSLIGAVGGLVGGKLDGWFGPKRAIIIELVAILVILIIQLSVTQDAIFYGLIPAGHEIWTGFGTGFFPRLSDVFYFCMVIPAAIAIVACISSSRYMLVHISPPEKIGEFFGFYAMAGSVTVWMGPLLVRVMTDYFGDQRLGFSFVGLLFLAGLLILLTVKADKTPEHMKTGA